MPRRPSLIPSPTGKAPPSASREASLSPPSSGKDTEKGDEKGAVASASPPSDSETKTPSKWDTREVL